VHVLVLGGALLTKLERRGFAIVKVAVGSLVHFHDLTALVQNGALRFELSSVVLQHRFAPFRNAVAILAHHRLGHFGNFQSAVESGEALFRWTL